MGFRTGFLMLLVFTAAGSGTAQNKTITNADLEKYRQERLTAEREYRENHVRLGMPSPEELDRRNEASRKELMEVSARLRDLEVERETARLQVAEVSPVNFNVNVTSGAQTQGIAPAVLWGLYGRGTSFARYPRYRQQPYYVGGGSIWPVGPRTRSTPLIKVRKR